MTDGRLPAAAAGEGFEQIRIEGFWLALSEKQDVGGEQSERHRACANAERRRVVAREHEGEPDADEESGEHEQDVQAFDPPNLAVAVVSGMGVDNIH